MPRLPTLDIDLVRTFVAVAEAASFTAAGNAIGATQSAMSVRIRKLEDRLGRRLMDRNPRSVTLTGFGAQFLDDARRLLQVHDETAIRMVGLSTVRSFALAVSDHAAGDRLPQVLAALQARCPGVQFLVTVGASAAVFEAFERGRFEAVVIRRDEGAGGGQSLYRDALVWTAAPGTAWHRARPLPLVSLAAPCGVRAAAVTALGAAGIIWRDVFCGTGVAAVQAAVSAGLGVACLSRWTVPADAVRLGPEDGLPALPSTEMVLRHRPLRPDSAAIVREVAAAFRQGVEGAG